MELKSVHLYKSIEHVDIDMFDYDLIVDLACDGLITDYSDFRSYALSLSQKKLSFEEMTNHLRERAVSQTNIDKFENLNWRFVAARILLMQLYAVAKANRKSVGLDSTSYYEYVQKCVELGIYDSKITKLYSKDDFDQMQNEFNFNYNLEFDYAGVNLLKKRYLVRYKGKAFELPNEMFATIALLIASPEKKNDRLDIAKKIYHSIASRKLSLATPIALNLRKPNGNLASCFITAMDDDLNSIYYTLDQLAQISKNGGGAGVNMSRIRSHGGYIRGVKGAAAGVLPWAKLVNDTAIAVNQLGSRAGAITVALDVWHKDIQEFLDMQTENGDQRKKSFDIFPQVVIPDLFMKRVENNEAWTLMDPHEIKSKYNIDIASLWGSEFDQIYEKLERDNTLEFRETISAKNLFKKVLKTTIETGLPYVFYKDTTNRLNPNKHNGFIGNANLCTESFSNFRPTKVGPKVLSKSGTEIKQDLDVGEVHTCNLISLNLSLVNNDKDLEDMSKLAIRMLDNAIDITTTPIPEAQKHNSEYRILGLGAMGLADYLAKRGIHYSKSAKHVDNLFEKIALYSTEESINLAQDRGAYPNYKGSEWSKKIFFGKDEDWFKNNSEYAKDWVKLMDKVEKYGIRNGGLIAIAPNTSTSLLMGCTASILPIYRKFFMDKSEKGVLPIVPPYLNAETFWTYKENKNIDQRDIVEVVSNIQKWVDQGISMELILNLKEGIKAKDVYDLYIDAWKKGCKTVYYIRSITLDSESSKEECVSCSG